MIKKVSVQEFDAIYEIMSVSFPRCERRTKDGQRALFSLANYTVYGWYEQKRICAFLAAYTLAQWRFVEHLATDQTFRGQNIGHQLMEAYVNADPRKVVLEVEPDENAITHRRIAFYKRLGFSLYPDFPYAQPSFHGEKAVPLCLMVNDKHLKTDDLRAIQRSLYQDVYHLDISNII